jgi:phosphoribosylanthranilate isomerase
LPDALVPSEVLRLKRSFPDLKVMRTIPVRGEADIAVAKSYEGIADFLLLDTWKPGDPGIGATGLVHDWQISRRIVAEVKIPVILAGGIGPENALEAVRLVKPAGVDSKTKTDLPGGAAKDLRKVEALVRAIRNTR